MQMLDSEEAAHRLGVKVQTLYSYVSRGQLSAHRGSDGRRIAFRADEIDERAKRMSRPERSDLRAMTISTAVSRLTPAGPSYRGRSAVEMAGRLSFEDVADLLWVASPGAWTSVRSVASASQQPGLAARDRLRLAVVLTGAQDPLRADLRPDAIMRAGRRLITTMVESLPIASEATAGPATATPLAHRLAARLGAADASGALLEAVNAILVIQADHELAPSTLSVRIAASIRADCYDAVLSGLGAISGAVHGGAADYVRTLLEAARENGVDRALGEALRWQGSLPGFGHIDYPDGDPRFQPLMRCFERLADERTRGLVGAVVNRAASQHLPAPNVDLAIGAIAFAGDLAPDAGETMITVSRTVGWIAHYLEELDEMPRRIRAQAG